jgi:hypothetical protein
MKEGRTLHDELADHLNTNWLHICPPVGAAVLEHFAGYHRVVLLKEGPVEIQGKPAKPSSRSAPAPKSNPMLYGVREMDKKLADSPW